MSRVPVGVCISGSGTNLQALIDAATEPGFPARIAVVVSNRKRAGGLVRAQEAGIPTVVLPHRRFADRAAFDAALVEALRTHDVEWVALAGFMRIVTAVFLDAFPQRVINIHPSLLPAFPGLDGQGQAHAAGVRIAGCTLHFVDEGTDTGPIIAQGATAVLPDDTPADLGARILRLEHVLYPQVLRWAAEGRLTVRDGQVDVDLPPGQTTWRFLSP